MTNRPLKVCLILTGGTVIQNSAGRLLGVKKKKDLTSWLAAMPEIQLLAPNLDVQFFYGNQDADLPVQVWQKTARFIYKNQKKIDGFVILSSLDNIPYFSQILSLMLENPNLPIIFTGSQLPDYLLEKPKGLKEILEASHDVGLRANLINSFQVILREMYGIYIMFGGKLIYGKSIALHKALLATPFICDPESVPSQVEFSIKLNFDNPVPKRKQVLKKMVLHDNLEFNIGYFDINPLFNFSDYQEILSKLAGAVFKVPSTVSIPKNLLAYLKRRKPTLPSVFFGRSLIWPDIKHKNISSKHGIFVLKEQDKARAIVRFMWALGQTQNFKKLAKILLS